MVEGGPIDVLTGDWLAELTMLILARQRMKHGAGSGYARTFLTQMEQVLGTCLERGIKVVSNAGGLDPAGCARGAAGAGDRARARRRGSRYVEGDDLLPRLDELTEAGETLHQPRHRRGLRLASAAGPDRQRLPRRPRHHRGPRRRRRRRHHRSGHRRRARGRTRRVVARLGLRRRPRARRRSPAPSSRATSSSAARRPPAATTPSSPRSPASSTSASPGPRSPPTAAASSASTTAPAGW